MLQDSGRSRVIACHSRDIGNILLYDYHLEYIKWWKEKWWPGRDMVWVLVGVRSCVAMDTGHSLVTLLSLSSRLRTVRCRSQTYYPEHILVYGRLEDLLLSCRGSGSFWPDWLEAGMVEVLAPHWVRDSGARAWSPSLDGDLDLMTEEWWVGPACAWGTSGHVFWGT